MTVCFRLQVEERDSGTESDDEAERADTGESSLLQPRARHPLAYSSRPACRTKIPPES